MAAHPGRDREPFMAHWAKCRSNQTGSLHTVVADGEVAGNIVLWEDQGDFLVGYWLGKDYWGKGIASAALGQFLAVTGERPLKAYVAKGNVASIRVLQKCGFTLIGQETDAAGGEEYLMELRSHEQTA